MKPRDWIVFALVTVFAAGPLVCAACSSPKAVDCRVEFAKACPCARDAGSD